MKWSNFTVSPNLTTNYLQKQQCKMRFILRRYTNDLKIDQATIQIGVSSDVKDFGFANSFRYLIKKIPFESGFQYIYHDLQPQKVEVENLNQIIIHLKII